MAEHKFYNYVYPCGWLVSGYHLQADGVPPEDCPIKVNPCPRHWDGECGVPELEK